MKYAQQYQQLKILPLNPGECGYFVKDLEVMKDFWGNLMGMTLTKSSEGAAFYSADPEGVDHEIAIMQGDILEANYSV